MPAMERHTCCGRVKRDLESAGAVVVEDATAEMRGGDPGPILEKWRKAIEDGAALLPRRKRVSAIPVANGRCVGPAPWWKSGASVRTVSLTGTMRTPGAPATWW